MYTVDSIALSKKDGSCMRVTNLRGATNIITGLHNVEFMESDQLEGTSNKMMIKYPKEGWLYILANEQQLARRQPMIVDLKSAEHYEEEIFDALRK